VPGYRPNARVITNTAFLSGTYTNNTTSLESHILPSASEEEETYLDTAYHLIAKTLEPRYVLQKLNVYLDDDSTGSLSRISPADLHHKMIGSVVAVKFGLEFRHELGLVPFLHDVHICQLASH